MISNYAFNASILSNEQPSETFSISFVEVEVEVKYVPYAEAAIAVGFDTATNVKR